MASSFPSGKVVLGSIINTAIASATAIVFKDINGNTHTFGAGERLIITKVRVNNRATAKDITILQDTDGGADLDAGEQIYVASFGAAGIWTDDFDGLPTLKINAAATNFFYAIGSAAGAVDIFITGEVIKA